ncbi:MAG TPA: hypothetical protein EYO53_00225 [Alphaproteobacteria bacterium]|nr:hypothetical protein [Alphaproteobacteria bacterium]
MVPRLRAQPGLTGPWSVDPYACSPLPGQGWLAELSPLLMLVGYYTLTALLLSISEMEYPNRFLVRAPNLPRRP